MSARQFADYLKIRDGTMERAGLSEDLNLHDALHDMLVNSRKRCLNPAVTSVIISDCVFQGLDLVARPYGGYSTGASVPEVVIPLVFKRCTFTRPLAFQAIRFTRPVEFEECRFERFVDCSRSHFSGICFHDCVFQEKVYFEDTCFSKRASTSRCMTERIKRSGAEADFSESAFLDGADFDRAVFFAPVTFAKARFYEATTFTDIRFHRYGNAHSSSQSLAQSSWVLSFTAAQVFGSVGFLKSANDPKTEDISQKESSSHRTQACSCERLFGHEAVARLFEQRYENHRGQSRKEPLEIDFTNVFIHSKYGLRFHSVNLEKCKLVGTNLDVCFFNNVRWPRVRAHIPVSAPRGSGIWAGVIYTITKLWNGLAWLLRWLVWSLPLGAGSRNEEERQREIRNRQMYGIYDHVCLLNELNEMDNRQQSDGNNWPEAGADSLSEALAQISKAYRGLKVAYEQDRDYIYASDFHFGEKELRRMNPEVPWPTKVQLNLFWLINGYGERALRPVGWFVCVWVIGACVYWWNGELTRPSPSVAAVATLHAAANVADIASHEMQEGDSSLVAGGPRQVPSFVRVEPKRGEGGGQGLASGQESGNVAIGWWEAAGFSLGTMAFLKPDFLVPKATAEGGWNWTGLLIGFQTLAGPALFAMFALAIRNKLKR